jgi:hypothetical protein
MLTDMSNGPSGVFDSTLAGGQGSTGSAESQDRRTITIGALVW